MLVTHGHIILTRLRRSWHGHTDGLTDSCARHQRGPTGQLRRIGDVYGSFGRRTTPATSSEVDWEKGGVRDTRRREKAQSLAGLLPPLPPLPSQFPPAHPGRRGRSRGNSDSPSHRKGSRMVISAVPLRFATILRIPYDGFFFACIFSLSVD